MTKIPPHALEAEEALIGAALLRPAILGEASHVVDPADFYKPFHADFWAAMLSGYQTGAIVDPVTIGGVMAEPQDAIRELHRLSMAVPSVTAWRMYADQIIETSRRRHLIAHLSEIVNDAYGSFDVDELVDRADAARADPLIASRAAKIDDVYDVPEFMEFAEKHDALHPALVPGLFRAMSRTVIVASEGLGKMVLMRQCALHIAAGRDPFDPVMYIEPRRVLMADFENPSATIASQLQLVNTARTIDLVSEAGDSMKVWSREGGVDLRKRRDRAEFEAVIQRSQPEILFAGPLYKMFRRARNDDMEQATIEFLEILDDLRTRYGFALMLEHHAPKAQGHERRVMNPFGSSALLRWPDVGLTMETDGEPSMTDPRIRCKIGRFRRDRQPANWPDQVERGDPMSSVAWAGRWSNGR